MQRRYYILFALILLIYIANLFIDIMVVDALEYAQISLEMLKNKSFLKVYSFGNNYLDKPPLLFWLNSLSYYLFGIHNWSYKLPSLLYAILGIYSTYRFSRLFYSEETAILSALMLASTQALFLITNDVRTDTMLMGAVIFSIWQLAAFFETDKTSNLLLGAVGISLALLAKGPIGLFAPAFALGPHILLRRQWRSIINWRIIIAVLIIALMLLPMCIGLYEQYDMKGLRFYFWTQSFGRITGESSWHNSPDSLFLIHSTAWAFMPWSLFLFWAWGRSAYTLVRNRLNPRGMSEIISFSGFTLVMIALTLSAYQLPHYIFVVYPLAAVLTAAELKRLSPAAVTTRVLMILQVILLLTLIVIITLLQYCFKGADILSIICIAVLFPVAIYLAIWSGGPVGSVRNIALFLSQSYKKWSGKAILPPKAHVFFDILYQNIFIVSIAVMLVCNIMLSLFYFPAIMKYQPGSDFGRYIRAHAAPVADNNFILYQYTHDISCIYYAQRMPVAYYWQRQDLLDQLDLKKKLIVITSPTGIDDIREAHIDYKIIEERDEFYVASLTPAFINPTTRSSVCGKAYLVELNAAP